MRRVGTRGSSHMHRRAFLKSAAGAGILGASGLATPAISQRAAARVVRLVPHADLANFDPIWTTAYIARNAGLLVWDTLYGVDADGVVNTLLERDLIRAVARKDVPGRPF